jgi:Protein of unknown function (DUF3558)
MKTLGHHRGMRTAVLSSLLLTLATGALTAGCSAGHSPTPAGTPTRAGTPAAGAAAATTTPTNGTAGKYDPCTLLTTDQVAAALGQPPAAGKPEPDFDAPECEWDPASGQNGTVTLGVGPWDGNPGVKPLRLGAPVSGVGDAAYDSGNTGLYVRKGSQGIRVWVFNVSTQSSRLDLEKQLAAVVLAKI